MDLNEVKPRMIKEVIGVLTGLWKSLNELKMEHFPMRYCIQQQMSLAMYDICDKLKRVRLTYVDIRDHSENLFCLLLHIKKNHKHTASVSYLPILRVCVSQA